MTDEQDDSPRTYLVRITRTMVMSAEVEIEAYDPDDAEQQALDQIESQGVDDGWEVENTSDDIEVEEVE